MVTEPYVIASVAEAIQRAITAAGPSWMETELDGEISYPSIARELIGLLEQYGVKIERKNGGE